jgi:hypothetical protein
VASRFPQVFFRFSISIVFPAIVLLSSIFLLPTPLLAQVSTGAISGTISDPSGAAVGGATVTVTETATGATHTLRTDSAGFYSAEGLTVGQYKVEVSAAGFQDSVTNGIQIDPGTRRTNNVTMTVGAVTSQVEVTTNAQQINTESSESGGTISSEQIGNLMLNGRNFQTLAIAVPGVASTSGADSLTGGGLEGGTTLIVNGNSVEYTTYTIDGTYNMNSGNLANINILPIVDGIAEFSVLKDNYSARYGFAGSGQIVVETKSGSSTYHGSAWDYLRNNAFDATNYFSTSTLALHQNIFGYTLGGPLSIPHLYNNDRKKTFFFASNQWYAINAGQVSRGAVFSQAMRGGNMSASPTLPSGGLALDAHSVALLASEGKTGCLLSTTEINPSCLDPVALALMNAYVPLPNDTAGGFNNYINQDPLTTSQVDDQYRIDHYITPNNLLIGRIMYEQVKNGFPYDAWGGTPYTTITDSYYTTAFNGLVRWQDNITPNLINTLSASETYDKPRINFTGSGGTMPSGITIPQYFPNAPTLNRIPSISISDGYSGNGVSSQPITASDGEGILGDDASWVHGKHVLQGGALYIFGIKNQNVFTTPQGSFTFTGVHTGDPAADYLLGLDATYYQASSQKLGSYHYRQGEAYFQDDWKALPNLTLNLGVRWVYFSSDTVSGNEATSFIPSLYNAAAAPAVNPDGSFVLNAAGNPVTSSGTTANLLNGLAYAGQNGIPSGFFIPVKTNFGPRLGFAYTFGNANRNVIRGGWGIGYSRIPLEQIYADFGQNPPYNDSANINNSLLSHPTAGTAAAPTPQTLDDVGTSFTPSDIESYSLTVERQVLSNLTTTLAYIGSESRHLETFQGGYDANFPLPVSAPSQAGCLAPGQAPSNSYQFDPCINTGVSSENYTRPYKGYAAMDNEYDEGYSNYNSLQASAGYRSGSSQFSLAYTYGKALATLGSHSAGGTTSQGAAAQNMYDFHAEYGPPSYDFTNDITGTWVWAIPGFQHSAKPLDLTLGGWSFSGLAVHQSGFAMSPSLGVGTAGLATRPNQVAPYHELGQLGEWFDTSVYQQPAYGFFGDSANGEIRGPGYTSANFSLDKTFAIVERFKMQFRAEAFNVLNHPNFSAVDTGVGDGSYGQVTSARDPRILEFALKMTF